jgi:hypothetical protein
MLPVMPKLVCIVERAISIPASLTGEAPAGWGGRPIPRV